MQVIDSTPGMMNRKTYMMYATAALLAKERLYITTAYFAPDQQLFECLVKAARRGVDVRIVLPAISDYEAMITVGETYYRGLLAAGVKIYERRSVFLHAKTAVVDGVWSTVGSTNLDLWSLLRDDEINTVIISREFAAELEDLFREDMTRSVPADTRQVDNTPWLTRVRGRLLFIFRHWL